MLCTPDHQNENMPGLTHLQAYQRSIHLFYYLRRPTQVKTLRQALTETNSTNTSACRLTMPRPLFPGKE